MKKLLFILSFLFISNSFLVNAKSSYTINKSRVSFQQTVYEAYAFHNGYWHKGRISINQYQNGYQLVSYSFNDISNYNGQPLSGNFYQGQQLIRLNPNNELAKANNFTHYVEIQGLKAYIIAN